MIRQLLISVVVLVAAAAAWIILVPGAHETLLGVGINLPFGASADAATTPQGAGRPGANGGGGSPGAGPARGGPGGGAPGAPGGRGGFGARESTVVTAAATTATINNKLTAIGEGLAVQSVTVVAQAAGQIDSILVSPGQMVKAGDVLVRLDNRSEQIDLDKATLAANDAADALKRVQALARTNSASQVQVAAAQLANDNAQLALKTAQLALDKRSITTPIDGRVGLFQVTAGNYVTAQTVVTTVEDTSSLLVSFWVPERFAPSIRTGMPVMATATALPGETLDGTVTAVDNQVDPTSRTLQVRASLPNAKGDLRAGMSFLVSLDFKGDQYPSVDPLSIQWSADGAYVWKYLGGKVTKVPVTIIERNSDGVLVKGGVQRGDEIVTQGVQQLAEGASVRLLDQPAAARGGSQNGQPGGKPAPGAQPGAQGAAGDKPGAGPNAAKPGGSGPAAQQS